jgi:hypothetical protein
MKQRLTFFLLFSFFIIQCQEIEKISIPDDIVYNYVSNILNDKAKSSVQTALIKNDYSFLNKNLMIGPTLWKRFKEKETLKNIPGEVLFHINDIKADGRMSETIEDSKKIWEEIKKEVSGDFKFRKANESELKYYWSTISFDIEEPLLILETKSHIYIMNFMKKDLSLFWVDEFPSKNAYQNPIDNKTYKTEGEFKTYRNGEEVYMTSKGNKETKLEKGIFLSSDEELRENYSPEEINNIIGTTNKIFENLFKNSDKSGKIMIQFELSKEKNLIEFAVRDDVDLEIMKEFEKRLIMQTIPKQGRIL